MFDVRIDGGLIVDGTGTAPIRGDLSIRDGRIAAIGDFPGAASESVDARGCIVTPGFIDLHTHYDGQVTWDSQLAPSSLHGVTTAVIGNCGVGFAPVRPDAHRTLIRLMEGVEDIPGSALSEGIRWGWESFAEFIDAVDAMPHAIDLCLQVPHDALRLYVMRERAERGEPATADDIAAMRSLLAEALDAGAIGFSTGRSDNHRTADGLATPAARARRDELVGLAAALAGRTRGVLQLVNDFRILHGDEHFGAEFDLIDAMAEAAGRPLSLSLMQRDQSPDQWRLILDRVEAARARGLPMFVQTAPRGIGVLLGLEATFHPFVGFPFYKEIAGLPLKERVAALRDPVRKARLLVEKSEPLAGDGSPIPPLADMLLAAIEWVSWRIFVLGAEPNYEPDLATSIGARATAAGRPALSALYDALLEGDGHALLYFPIYNYTEGHLGNVATMMNHDAALPGLSDGGAHVGTICDASFPTYSLIHWARDRRDGRVPVEQIVHRHTARVADYLGLSDRGRLSVGKRADINVIDHANLRLRAPRVVHDLPAGGRRFIQDVAGMRATFVAGRRTLAEDVPTGLLPGRVVRA
jgi:N-acyl-D-aspartate/D-glutamate deacylase